MHLAHVERRLARQCRTVAADERRRRNTVDIQKHQPLVTGSGRGLVARAGQRQGVAGHTPLAHRKCSVRQIALDIGLHAGDHQFCWRLLLRVEAMDEIDQVCAAIAHQGKHADVHDA